MFNTKPKLDYLLKGTVSVNDPTCKDGNGRFTTVCLINNELDIDVGSFKTDCFLLQEQKQIFLNPEKRKYLL